MNKKVKGFSLVELLVSFVLISIIVASGYSAFTYFSKNFIDIKKRNQKMIDVTQFLKIIEYDAQMAKVIINNNKALDFSMNDSLTVKYEFKDTLAIRSAQLNLDTFNINLQDVQLTENRKKVVFLMRFDFTFFENKKNVVVVKKYDAASLLAEEIKELNNE